MSGHEILCTSLVLFNRAIKNLQGSDEGVCEKVGEVSRGITGLVL